MNPYVNEMRSLIGAKPLLLCGASVIVFDPLGRVLMLHRTDNDSWCFPGGAIELGEQVEDAARREVYEETGLIVNEIELFGVFSGKELHYVYPNGDEVYIVDVVYTCNQYKGHVNIDSESKHYDFFELNQLPKKISPPVIPVIKKLLEQEIKSVK